MTRFQNDAAAGAPVRALLVGLLLLLPAPGAGQTGHAVTDVDIAYEAAAVAWEEGRFVDALEGLERILTSDADAPVADIALLTGELFPTREVAPDGRGVRWSPDGRHFAFRVERDGVMRTRVVSMDADTVRTVAEVAGGRLVFSPDGRRAAYLLLSDRAAFDEASTEVMESMPVTSRAEFMRRARALDFLRATYTDVAVLDLGDGSTRIMALAVDPHELAYDATGTLHVLAATAADTVATQLYRVVDGEPRRLTDSDSYKTLIRTAGTRLVYDAGEGRTEVAGPDGVTALAGYSAAVSADGSTLAFLRDVDGATELVRLRFETGARELLLRSAVPLSEPALSARGDRVAYQAMPRDDWELYVVDEPGTARRVTREIQHDLFPAFIPCSCVALPGGTDRPAGDGAAGRYLLGIKGEGRHRRSYIHDLETGSVTRLFHNNTVRTVAPEYEWRVSPDGSKILIAAERDGDTISPEWGLYLVDLETRLPRSAILDRVRTQLADERSLLERGRRMFLPVADRVRGAVADVSTRRIYGHARDLYGFGSKYVTQPGNRMAIDYLVAELEAMGYEPELQWLDVRGNRTANVIATLPGTAHPDVVYVVSSHFDSVERGPGADDNSSGTTALLEAARVLRHRPQPATIRLAFFTGEEAGLWGSREFVRRAVEADVRIVGALNNDMVGWTGDGRLDNTIRYSNAGLRDVQHAAAALFTDLITYDAKYYKFTDAHAYYEAYGDIVAGIGSYPILANPHYHREHDILETITQRLVAEVSKTTVASLILMASSPSRPRGLRLVDCRAEDRAAACAPGEPRAVTWEPAPESDVVEYRVLWGPAHAPGRHAAVVRQPRIGFRAPPPAGTVIAVEAVNAAGLRSWDRARLVLP